MTTKKQIYPLSFSHKKLRFDPKVLIYTCLDHKALKFYIFILNFIYFIFKFLVAQKRQRKLLENENNRKRFRIVIFQQKQIYINDRPGFNGFVQQREFHEGDLKI